jgi:hypothetical protein
MVVAVISVSTEVCMELGLCGIVIGPSFKAVVWELSERIVLYGDPKLLGTVVDPSGRFLVWEQSDITVMGSEPELVENVHLSSTTVVCDLSNGTVVYSKPVLLGKVVDS